MSDLTFASAATLAAAIRAREVSSCEVVEAHFDRISVTNRPAPEPPIIASTC